MKTFELAGEQLQGFGDGGLPYLQGFRKMGAPYWPLQRGGASGP